MLFHPKRYKLLLEQVDAAERSIANLGEQQRQIHEDLTQQQTQYERDVAALRAQLEEEVQAREALAQQVATIAAQKTTQRRRKPDA